MRLIIRSIGSDGGGIAQVLYSDLSPDARPAVKCPLDVVLIIVDERNALYAHF